MSVDSVIRKEILPNIKLSCLRSDKYKTGCLSVSFLTLLDEKTAAKNALIPMVLRRGCMRYPDMRWIAAELDMLYGARIEPMVRKKGEVQCVGFYCDFVDGDYIDGGRQLENVVSLLSQILLEPLTRGGLFVSEYVDGEIKNLVDLIDAQINDKRQYAVTRLFELMCSSERYGITRYGGREEAEAIYPLALTKQYRELLQSSAVEIFYCGSAEPARVESALTEALMAMPRGEPELGVSTAVHADVGEPRYFTDHMDVGQGKLSLGFRMGESVVSGNYPAQVLFNTLFGGSTTSKLFLNVREKLSLCYYASSSLEKHKGLMVVSSGIEFDKYGQALDEILVQLEACRRGDISPDELEAARRYMVSSLRAAEDSQGRLEDFWLGQNVEGLDYSSGELANLVSEVTIDEVAAAAQAARLDSVYFLAGPVGEEEG